MIRVGKSGLAESDDWLCLDVVVAGRVFRGKKGGQVGACDGEYPWWGVSSSVIKGRCISRRVFWRRV